MLRELKIQNLAIIDSLSMSFVEGLNVISGETGAGKSIIIGAVGLLLGDRASADLIRSSEESAIVEAMFDIREKKDVREKLESMGFHADDELVVKRIVTRAGKNKIYINGHLSTLGMLSSLSESLVNICSQHEHQLILNADNHLDILDEFGELMPLRREYSDLYGEYLSLKEHLARLQSINRNKMEREDFLKFQIKEIEDADITADEDSALQDEKKVLNNAKKLSELARESHDILYAGENAVLEKLTRIIHDVEEIRNIDTRFEISGKDLETIFFSLEDVSFRIRDYGNRITFSPERLETIEDRLEYLGRLKRKYGSSLGDILRKKEELRDELEGISSVEEDIQKLSQGVIAKKEVLLEKAVQLSKKRKEVASQLKREIEGEIHTLRMKNTVFEARFNESHDDSVGNPVVNWRGIDDMEFYLSTNIGEELKPMNRIASGGELSRIVLAMKKVLARTGSVSTIIFDEVDTGIGGATAEIVGKKLQEVSDHHQVICISHLPQIVCFGDNHFLVAKKVTGERTNTEVRVLAHEERLEEITRMLGGVHVTEKTREHAHEMLKAAHDSTGTME